MKLPGESMNQEVSSPIPSYLLGMTSIAIAHISLDGLLVEANKGFLQAAGLPEDAFFVDVVGLFLEPRFITLQQLAIRDEGGNGRIYTGLLNLGQETGSYHTLQGTVFRSSLGLLVAAEHQIKDVEALSKTLLELNEELVEQQRSITRLNNELKRKQGMLATQSPTDTLTGLANRRQLFQRLSNEIMQAQTTQQPLSIIMMDIDHFKRVNDTCGHLVGDEVLHAVSQCLKGRLRPQDFIGRYGGKEFVVVLPLSSLEAAAAIAERLRQGVASLRVASLQEPITSSFGVASWEGSTVEAFLERADAALYRAKQDGRNRVAVATST